MSKRSASNGSRGRADLGIRLLNGFTQVQFLPGALRRASLAQRLRHFRSALNLSKGSFSFPDDVKVAWPPVKRLVVVRVHVGEPFHTERVRLAEGAALKTAAPSSVSGVRIPGVPPLFCPHGAKAACMTFTQENSEHHRVRVPFSLKRLIAQKQSGRLTSGRPGSITSSGDHFLP